MASSPRASSHANGNSVASSGAPRPWALDDTLRLIAELAGALEEQCARAQAECSEANSRAVSRARMEALSLRAQEIRVRSETIAREIASPPSAHSLASAERLNGSAETRACAVAFAVAVKLDGVSRERAEALLMDEFGRDDAVEIADEVFGAIAGSPEPSAHSR